MRKTIETILFAVLGLFGAVSIASVLFIMNCGGTIQLDTGIADELLSCFGRCHSDEPGSGQDCDECKDLLKDERSDRQNNQTGDTNPAENPCLEQLESCVEGCEGDDLACLQECVNQYKECLGLPPDEVNPPEEESPGADTPEETPNPCDSKYQECKATCQHVIVRDGCNPDPDERDRMSCAEACQQIYDQCIRNGY